MPLATCPACHGTVPLPARFCPHCGASFEEPAPPADARALPLDLFTVGGTSSLAIDRAVTLGRSKANILCEHQDVAPTHCRLTPKADAWLVEDLSGEGVFAGPNRVSSTLLRAGEVVDIGGFPGAVALALPCGLGRPIPLLLRAPDGRTTRLVLQKLPMVVGRGSWVDLPLGDRNVSHTHARLRLEQGRVVLDDLQSRNGTFVGGERVQKSRPLQLGDVLKLGETELVFGEAPETARESEPLSGLSVESRGGTVSDAHVPAPRARGSDSDGCPSCGEPAEALATSLGRTAVGREGTEARSEVGRCGGCGARLALCPACGAANSVPSLFEQLACRRCDRTFVAG